MYACDRERKSRLKSPVQVLKEGERHPASRLSSSDMPGAVLKIRRLEFFRNRLWDGQKPTGGVVCHQDDLSFGDDSV
ncbi:hypothetical protein CEXT_327051 [Caerostris extrusa]|uniref:Uncharacterized protein n=1 Tax=Caerostris extrusa TaxID=172846 RepID=A0AAV4SX92_CAEEX|nr:hypothetical protein CEXT_327051 [Caerostris extrusa]